MVLHIAPQRILHELGRHGADKLVPVFQQETAETRQSPDLLAGFRPQTGVVDRIAQFVDEAAAARSVVRLQREAQRIDGSVTAGVSPTFFFATLTGLAIVFAFLTSTTASSGGFSNINFSLLYSTGTDLS